MSHRSDARQILGRGKRKSETESVKKYLRGDSPDGALTR
jgi:hypothetical protein